MSLYEEAFAAGNSGNTVNALTDKYDFVYTVPLIVCLITFINKIICVANYRIKNHKFLNVFAFDNFND